MLDKRHIPDLIIALVSAVVGAVAGTALTFLLGGFQVEIARQQVKLEASAWLTVDSLSNLRIIADSSRYAIGPESVFNLYLSNNSKWPLEIVMFANKTSVMPQADLWYRLKEHAKVELEKGELVTSYQSDQNGLVEPGEKVYFPIEFGLRADDTLSVIRRHVMIVSRTPHQFWTATYVWADFVNDVGEEEKTVALYTDDLNNTFIEFPVSHFSYKYFIPSDDQIKELVELEELTLGGDSTELKIALRQFIEMTR